MPDWTSRFSLAGKTALVTGASSGIGTEIAMVFADAGARVLASGRDVARLEAVARRIAAQGGTCHTIPADLLTTAGCEALVRAALDTVRADGASADGAGGGDSGARRGVDILVNNAGIAITGPALSFGIGDWDRIMALNLRAPFLLARGLAPAMIAAGGGKIVNISSQAGVIALADHAAYTASKAGLNGLTRALMVELAPHNIQVNAICPTVVMTAMGRQVWGRPEKSGPMLAATPLGRFGEPVEIADMALYLASPASDLVNGTVMMIEGGYTSV